MSLMAHDPSVRDYADTSPAMLGRRMSKVARSRPAKKLVHDASLILARRASRVYRFSGTRKPRFSLSVVPS